MKWVDKEHGPACFCGGPTFVSVGPKGEADLVCIFHSADAGALFPLPQERPDNWPNLSNEEVDKLMFDGQNEYDAKETHEEDEHSVPPGTLN